MNITASETDAQHHHVTVFTTTRWNRVKALNVQNAGKWFCCRKAPQCFLSVKSTIDVLPNIWM